MILKSGPNMINLVRLGRKASVAVKEVLVALAVEPRVASVTLVIFSVTSLVGGELVVTLPLPNRGEIFNIR